MIYDANFPIIFMRIPKFFLSIFADAKLKCISVKRSVKIICDARRDKVLKNTQVNID